MEPETATEQRHAGSLGHVRERLSIIAVEDIAQWLVGLGFTVRPVHSLLADDVVVETKVDIVDGHQIEVTVVVVIEESGAGAPAPITHGGELGDIFKTAGSVVSQQAIHLEIGHIDVLVAVVVVIGDRTPRTITGIARTRPIGDIREGSTLVAVQSIDRRVSVLGRVGGGRQERSVRQIEVLPAVSVYVDESGTGSESLYVIVLAGEPVDVNEVDPGSGSHVNEDDRLVVRFRR